MIQSKLHTRYYMAIPEGCLINGFSDKNRFDAKNQKEWYVYTIHIIQWKGILKKMPFLVHWHIGNQTNWRIAPQPDSTCYVRWVTIEHSAFSLDYVSLCWIEFSIKSAPRQRKEGQANWRWPHSAKMLGVNDPYGFDSHSGHKKEIA